MKHFKTAISAICLASIVLLGACSDEPGKGDGDDTKIDMTDKFEPVQEGGVVQGDVDFIVLNRYQSGLENATYAVKSRKLYNKDELTFGKWELDTNHYMGRVSILPSSIVVRDGKVWKHVELFSCSTGPSAFGTALFALNTTLKKEYNLYVGRPFSVEGEERTLVLDKFAYGITQADGEVLVLSYELEYFGGRTHNGGWELEFGYYTKTEPLRFDDGKNLRFDSTTEAYDWLIEQFEATFGEVVNLNGIFNAILDDPYFHLSTLKAEREKFLEE